MVSSTRARLCQCIKKNIVLIRRESGFVYTQTNTRLWRKNRVPGSGGCYGTDINRNWNAGWALTGGASTDPCAETYKGMFPQLGTSILIDADESRT